jgi:hypothetical protein
VQGCTARDASTCSGAIARLVRGASGVLKA